jgi:DMSO reductase family type II enzyme chaperone
MRAAEPGASRAGANLDRARVYRGLARLFGLPARASLDALRGRDLPELVAALARLEVEPETVRAARAVVERLDAAGRESLESAYEETFEASGGLRCAPNETFHTGDTGERALVRTFELADIAGFYRAFGVEVAPGTERADHITAELEFMHLLAVKEALAQQNGDGVEHAEICREAARSFLRDHLARWAGSFGERLEESATDPLYAAAGRLLAGFVEFDAGRLGAVQAAARG